MLMTIPTFSIIGEGKVKTEAKRLASILRYLNDSAISTKETLAIKFDMNSDVLTWTMPEGERTERFNTISSIRLESKGTIKEGQVIIFFGPLGIQESLVAYLNDEKTAVTVELNRISGRVKIKQV